MDEILERVWEGAGDAWKWLRGVVLGEWEDNRTLSQCVTDALAGFVPVVGTVITMRDLIAIIVRLAKHPDKRDDVDEWILLIAMLLPLILTAITALAAGVGALVGAELGGFLRAVALFVVKKGGVAIRAIVEFMQAHGYGNAVKAMREIKFAKYKDALVKGLGDQITKIETLILKMQARLRRLSPESLPSWAPGRDKVLDAINHCDTFLLELKALRNAAGNMIPTAVLEMDARLNALLAGNLKAATQTRHTITTGQAAPAVAKLEPQVAPKLSPSKPQTKPEIKPEPKTHDSTDSHIRAGDGTDVEMLQNPNVPEPSNTRRLPERRVIALSGKREYKYVDQHGVPVGAKPYTPGQQLENPPMELEDWDKASTMVKDGYPDLTAPNHTGQTSTTYDTFAGLRTGTLPAGGTTQFKRVVSHDNAHAEFGTFYNRELPIDGEDLRAGSAVKEPWNKNGEFIELRVPPKGDPIWQELHALQQQSENFAAATVGRPPAQVPFKEELKFWEGPAASQVYKKQLDDGSWVDDDFYQVGGKEQQVFDSKQIALLKEKGFISERKPTNFPDYDPQVGNIVPKNGPYFEVIPLGQAMPPANAGAQ